jgi:hypothetical protein
MVMQHPAGPKTAVVASATIWSRFCIGEGYGGGTDFLKSA